MDHSGLRMTQNTYFSLLTHTKQFLLMTFWDTTAGNAANFRIQTDGENWMDSQIDMEVEIDKYLKICQKLMS